MVGNRDMEPKQFLRGQSSIILKYQKIQNVVYLIVTPWKLCGHDLENHVGPLWERWLLSMVLTEAWSRDPNKRANHKLLSLCLH